MKTVKLIPLAAWTLSAACSSSDGGSGGGPDALAYSALKVGASWVYKNTDLTAMGGSKETVVTKEITRCEMVSFVDCDTGETVEYNAYVQETTGGGANLEDSNTVYMATLDEGLVRVKQDFFLLDVLDHYVTYSPYFLRLYNGPYEVGRSEDYTHQRCEYLAADDSLRGQTTRRYRHEVAAVDEQVDVEAGSYPQALYMKRTDLSDYDLKEFWYADGVGKVLEKAYDGNGTQVSEEELSEFTEGTETCE